MTENVDTIPEANDSKELSSTPETTIAPGTTDANDKTDTTVNTIVTGNTATTGATGTKQTAGLLETVKSNRPIKIELEQVFKIYKTKELEVVALRGLDLKVRAGEIISIMGPSGCGKSTLLNMLGGLDKPSAGKVIFDGVNVVALEDDALIEFRKRNVGFVFQFFNLVPTLTAAENIELPMQLIGMYTGKRLHRRDMLLELVGMTDRGHHLPDELSGGEQQRIAIATALANDPSIILADEPTGELDTENGQMVLDLFARLRDEQGKTIIIVTHDPRIATIADRSLRIEDGLIKGEYTMDSYSRGGEPVDNIKYKRLVENIVDKKKRMEELLHEVMKIEDDLLEGFGG